MTLYLLVLHYSSETAYYGDLFRTESKAERIAEEIKRDDSTLLSYDIIDLEYCG